MVVNVILDNWSWSEIQCGRIWSVQNTGWCRPQQHKLANYLDANFSRTYAFKVWYEFERKPCWTCLWRVWIIFRSIPRIIQSSLSAPPWWNMYTCIATGGRLYIVEVVVGGANKIQSNKCNKCCRILPMNTNLQMVMQSLCPYFDASMLPFEFREWMGSSLVPPFDNNFSITWKAHTDFTKAWLLSFVETGERKCL